mgnify:CR=1 FL=1
MKNYRCDWCGENIGWVGKYLFGGLLHTCDPLAFAKKQVQRLDNATLIIGDTEIKVRELEAMINWTREEMKK